YEIMSSGIKKYSVGAPMQAPVDALFLLMERHGFKLKDVLDISVRLPSNVSSIVDNRTMPNINIQHIFAVILLDGDLTFEATHSYERMNDPNVIETKKIVTLIPDDELAAAKISRQGIVEVTTKDGARLREHVVSVRGSAENPMTTEEVEKKCLDLLVPVLGEDRSKKLIDAIWNLEQVRNVRELRPLLSPL
ncbi:MmgE/PrpD family protein, partial [Thermodesulfobacteriota bacterium]